MQYLYLHGYPLGAHRRHRGFELRNGFVDALIGHQPRADLGHRAGRNHGFRALASEAAADAVHLQRGPRPHALEERNFRFAH